jgi:translation initiation factor 2 alpha subunit (eIF-2alpha)
MLLADHWSGRRLRNKKTLITLGKIYFFRILRVDPEKGFIDLSIRGYDFNEEISAMNNFIDGMRLLKELPYNTVYRYQIT